MEKNGFNVEFLQKCWHIVKNDFYDSYDQFHQGTLCLQSINRYFITLVPIKGVADSVHDL
jgi:hypothetical protein